MNREQSFAMGDFTTTLSLWDDPAGILADLPEYSHAPSLLICDEHVLPLLPQLLGKNYEMISNLPQIRRDADAQALTAGASDWLDRPSHLRAVLVLPGGEKAKTMASVELILKTAFALGFARDSRFIALGGGALTDVSAFASSLFMRGNRLTLVPSTVLAMVDAAFGGKTGINYVNLKNMVGTFYPAPEVRVCPSFISTLSDREYKSGLAEVIKSAMLGDGELFELLEAKSDEVLRRDPQLCAEIIWRGLMVKGRVVSADLREQGIRAHLNLGHTFGHPLEALGGFGGWSHGEAVAWGIGRALELGVTMGVTEADYALRAEKLLRTYGFRLDSSGFDATDLLNAMQGDKKKQAGVLRFILQRKICDTFITEADANLVAGVLN